MAPTQFVLKDSPPELLAATPEIEPRGRHYNTEKAKEPGGISIDDVLLGMKLACISITDDEEDTLKKTAKIGGPWHTEALAMITGSVSEAHKPLSYILETYFNLKVDKLINETGAVGRRLIFRHPIDTQGYIAHNDEMIVLAFRCTTTPKDWIANLETSSSEWEIEEDVAQGHSGRFSVLKGRFGKDKKPRVHTGFYNNILQVIPTIREIIDPMLLDPEQPPRKLYVVGHSLGAGLSTLATAYFLLNYEWENLPHKLINISAGTPRSCNKEMCDVLNERLQELRPLDKAIMCRLVLNKDCVATLPPKSLGYRHPGKLVFINEDGEILVGPLLHHSNILDDSEKRELLKTNPDIVFEDDEDADDEHNDDDREWKTGLDYKKLVLKIPRPFRDHMPDMYLVPLTKLFEREKQKNAVQ